MTEGLVCLLGKLRLVVYIPSYDCCKNQDLIAELQYLI